jgi:hypothetical protein
VRVALAAVLMLIPLLNVAFASVQERRHHLLGLSVNFAAFALALRILWLVSRDRRQPWLPMATSCFDVTLITTAQVIFALQTDPQVVVNNKVTFETCFSRSPPPACATTSGSRSAPACWRWCSSGDDRLGGQQLPARHRGRGQHLRALPVGRPVLRVILLGCATTLNVFIVDGIQQQRKLSNADTGVFNRRFFDDYLKSEVARAAARRASWRWR